MGTTLTGTTPQDTYDSLIKVTDNGPLSGTLKKLTDGLGNDSSLSLSTTAASLSGTLAVTGASTFSSAITAATGSNFTGTAVNSRVLVTAAGVANTILGFNNSGSTANGVVNNAGYIGILQDYPLVVTIADAEKMRITGAGNVGIGTSAPQNYGGTTLTVSSPLTTNVGAIVVQNSDASVRGHLYSSGSGNLITMGSATASSVQFVVSDTERMRLTANGLTFNGDTAAANALDDYEEGTWTPAISFGGASVGVTYSASTAGTYTKIGRKVTVSGILVLTDKGSSTGQARITGLPFTIGAASGYLSTASIFMYEVSFANQFQAYGELNSTAIVLSEITEAGTYTVLNNSNFVNSSELIVSFTYFV